MKGRNLFHSFQRFGVPEDATAIFLPPDGSPSINHVMARVTGKQPSEILGTLRSEVPQADLWLINPNGVVVGKDAQIDVPSALHVSTADEIRSADAKVFSTRPAQTILSSAAPEAFGFLGAGAQPEIRFETVVPAGQETVEAQRLNLIGGSVLVKDADLLTRGELGPDIGIVATTGAVVIHVEDVAADRALTTFDTTRGGSLTIENSFLAPQGMGQGGGITLLGGEVRIVGSKLDAKGKTGGPILIFGRSIDVRGSSEDGVAAVVGDREAFDPELRAGPIELQAATIRIGQGGSVESVADRAGPDNPVTLEGESIVIDGLVQSIAREGPAAAITLSAAEVRIANDGVVESKPTLFPEESAAPGDIFVRAERQLTIRGGEGFTGISTSTTSQPGGNLTIAAPDARVALSQGGQIRTIAQGTAPAGNLTIDASRLFISGEGSERFTGIASSAVAASDTGANAGAIEVTADSIEIHDLGAIASDSSGGGDAGSVTVNAERIALREGGQISSLTLPVFDQAGELIGGSTGQGGTVRITASEKIVIAGEAFRVQAAPMLEENAAGEQEIVQVEVAPPSSITASTESPSGGQAGNVHVEAPVIRLANRGEISSESFNAAHSGNVTVIARHRLQLRDAEITTKANLADAGPVAVRSGRLIDLQDDGEISTTVLGADGFAGNITVAAPFVALNDSRIQANAVSGEGGDITVGADALIQTPASVIEALSEESIDGEVEVRRPDDPTSGVVALETSLEQRDELIDDPCAIRADQPISGFVVREAYRDVHDPEQPLPAPHTTAQTPPSGDC